MITLIRFMIVIYLRCSLHIKIIGGKVMLKEIDLYITEKCNLECQFCSIQASNSSTKELDFETIKKFVLYCKQNGVTDIHVTGGEPTLHKDYKRIIAFIIKNQIDVRLITNGLLLSESDLIELKQIGLEKIMISIDGMQKFHNSVRARGAYEKAFNVIDKAVSLNYNVRVNSVAWNENIEDIPLLMERLDKSKVNVYSVFLGSPVGRAKRMNGLTVVDAEMWMRFLEVLRSYHAAQGMRIKVVVEQGYIKAGIDNEHYMIRSCTSILSNTDYLSVRADGNVFPCVFFSNDVQSIGNIHNMQDLNFKRSMSNSDFYNSVAALPIECNTCENVAYCKGGCRGFNFVEQEISKDLRCCQDGYIPICPLIKIDLFNRRMAPCTDDLLE